MSPMSRTEWNRCRYDAKSKAGHYESYFQRANHPTEPRGFWIRYTLFSPKGQPGAALGELWAIYFDGVRVTITAVKEERPLSACTFSTSQLDVVVAGATLRDGALEGSAKQGTHELGWSLQYRGDERPLLLLPDRLYRMGFPKAKALVGTPNALYSGHLDVDGVRVEVEGWVGSQNHNWGSRHTDRYAWGQVAGFDQDSTAFLECSTARVKLGPVWTPWMTLLVLRLEGQELALNSLVQAVRAKGTYRTFDWRFDSQTHDARLRGHIHAPREAFVGLRYANPPGGAKTCLNSKLATCELTLERRGEKTRTLVASKRAAFEILTDATDHRVPIVA